MQQKEKSKLVSLANNRILSCIPIQCIVCMYEPKWYLINGILT